MKNIRKILIIAQCMIFLSCERELEFYLLKPSLIYPNKVDIVRKRFPIDTLRIDHIAVKNIDVNNPLHLSMVDDFVAKNLPTNYADYASYSIKIFKYAKIMSRVGADNNSDGRWYVMWNDNLRLQYGWTKGRFISRTHWPLYDEAILKLRLSDSEVVISDSVPMTWAKSLIKPKPMEFYPLYPPYFQHDIFEGGKHKRIDYFAVKMTSPKKPLQVYTTKITNSSNSSKASLATVCFFIGFNFYNFLFMHLYGSFHMTRPMRSFIIINANRIGN